jgi:hypothetical protein
VSLWSDVYSSNRVSLWSDVYSSYRVRLWSDVSSSYRLSSDRGYVMCLLLLLLLLLTQGDSTFRKNGAGDRTSPGK